MKVGEELWEPAGGWRSIKLRLSLWELLWFLALKVKQIVGRGHRDSASDWNQSKQEFCSLGHWGSLVLRSLSSYKTLANWITGIEGPWGFPGVPGRKGENLEEKAYVYRASGIQWTGEPGHCPQCSHSLPRSSTPQKPLSDHHWQIPLQYPPGCTTSPTTLPSTWRMWRSASGTTRPCSSPTPPVPEPERGPGLWACRALYLEKGG